MTSYETDHFINRELSWLRFNTRVLEEAVNPESPVLERLKFIAIYGTNLDEFYMIRVAGLQDMYKARVIPHNPDGVTVLDQLTSIRGYLHDELERIEGMLEGLYEEMAENGVHLKRFHQLTPEEVMESDEIFYSQLFPVIIPIAVDSTHPFPHLNNLSFAMAVKLREESSGAIRFGLVRIPRILPRFIEIGDTFVPISEVVFHHIRDLFPGFEPLTHVTFRVTRNADIVIEEEEADDFMEVLEEGIRLRRKGEIVRLEIRNVNEDEDVLDFLVSHLKVSPDDIYRFTTPLNLGSYWQIVGSKRFAHLVSKPITPKALPPLGSEGSIFTVVEKQDVGMFLPYESFDPVVRFIKEAAADKSVLAIKMTLYRVGANSPIVKALIEAAQEGKQVTAIVELKARFDEENNLKWAKALEEAGAHVVYGVVGLKIHAKITLVIKREKNRLKQYVHLATGNYNPSTARIYSDFSFFTANPMIAADATRFFHHISGFAKNTKLSILNMAPTQIKPSIIKMIEGEKEKGIEGEIIAKMNALVDPDVIEALYDAGKAGVKISLIIRGICCLRPGVPGISDNIRVISVVGKYLEHARIFYFKHAQPAIYFSSADWMPRNLVKRIELMTPVFDESIANLLHGILKLQLADNRQSRFLRPDGEYERVVNDLPPFDSQAAMEEYYRQLSKEVRKGKRSVPDITCTLPGAAQ